MSDIEYLHRCDKCGGYYNGTHICGTAIIEAPHGINTESISLTKEQREFLIRYLRGVIDSGTYYDITKELLAELERGDE